jgi:hypothetical protein
MEVTLDEARKDERMSEIVSDEEAVLDAIMAGLDAEYGVLPEAVLLQARQQREAIIPRLIDSIRAAATEIKAGRSVESNTHFSALFLLWEFRAKEALDVVVEAVSLPGDGAYELFGNAVTECLPRILAVMAEERLEVLDAMIRNPALDEFVRWEAANAFCYLARDGKLSREEIVPRLRQHLAEAIQRNDAEIVGPLVLILADFIAVESLDEIRLAFEKNLVETDFVDLESVLKDIAAGKSDIDQKEPAGIEDAIEELRFWLEFDPEPLDDPPRVAYSGPPLPMYSEDVEDVEESIVDGNATIRYDGPHVGRNDPCPCGSGRKFKKCCGSPTRSSTLDL